MFPLEIWGISLVRPLLDLAAVMTGLGSWATWLRAACFYCISYFVLTTLLVLDLETLRNAILTWSPRFKDTPLDAYMYARILKGRRVENGYRRGLIRRLWNAAKWLVVWTVYIVCVFTSLQASLQPKIASDTKALWDVMVVFGEQALLYVPVVFYYVGRRSIDYLRMEHVTFDVLLTFQLIMGLLVIRRIHRFWASTTAANASN